MPESVLCPGAVPRLAGGCASDNRDTRNYWIMAPRAGHHPLRRNPGPTHLRHEGLVVPLVQDLRTDIRVAAESRGHPPKGDYELPNARHAGDNPEPEREAREANPIQSKTYEITFLGQAGTTLSAEFDDCEVTIGPGTTTLRAELPDRGALSGLIERINSLGLDVIDVSLVAPPAGR